MKNICIDCNYVGTDGLWRIKLSEGIKHKVVDIHVKEDKIAPEFFDLDTIDVNFIKKEFSVSEEDAEKLIMDGEPICPKCKSMSYFIYNESMDGKREESKNE